MVAASEFTPEFEQGIAEFNQRQFYACHDTLEAIWVEAPEVDKRFYQGILQVAVGCYHLSNENLKGAIILLGEAIRRLCDYQPDYQGVNVELLLGQAINLLQVLQQLKPEQTKRFWQQLQQSQVDELTDSGQSSAEIVAELEPEQNLIANCQMPYLARV